MGILTKIVLPIHEHRYLSFFLLFVLSSVFFINVLWFSVYRSFTSLVKFIPGYHILLDAVVNGIVFSISLSDSLLLVYRNEADFYILIFCICNFTEFDYSFYSFMVKKLGLSLYNIMLPALLLSFQFGCLLVLFLA